MNRIINKCEKYDSQYTSQLLAHDQSTQGNMESLYPFTKCIQAQLPFNNNCTSVGEPLVSVLFA